MTEPASPTTLDRLAPLLPLLAAFVAFFALGLNEYLTLDTLRENRAALKEWVQANRTEAVLIFIGTYIVVAAASLPAGAVLS
ncbi:MAG: TVP38/TMEM64 family protein, partial [Alphaproteobacteria bacterium]